MDICTVYAPVYDHGRRIEAVPVLWARAAWEGRILFLNDSHYGSLFATEADVARYWNGEPITPLTVAQILEMAAGRRTWDDWQRYKGVKA